MIDVILDRLLDASLQGLIAVAAIGLLVATTRRLTPKMRCWLWRLCGLKMMVSLLVIASIPLLAAQKLAAPVALAQPSPVADIQTSLPIQATSAVAPIEPATVNWPLILVATWLIGVIILLAYRIANEFICRAKIFRSANKFEEKTDALEEIARNLGIRRCPRLYVSDEVHSPLVVGLWKPTVLVPRSMANNSTELEMALAHELAHVKRKDLAWQATMSLTSIVFWFLPPAHWIGKFAKLEAEMACDRVVLELIKSNPIDYSRLLVQLASHKLLPSGAIGMASHSRQHLERRIRVMNHKLKSPHLGAILLGALFVVPTLVPWRAIAQEPRNQAVPRKKFDELAMNYMGITEGDNELKITPEQRKLLEAQSAKAMNEIRALGQKLEDMKRANVSDKERIEYDTSIRMPMFRRQIRERWDLLTPAQQERQRQLTCQYFGPMVLGYADVASRIGLPESTRKSIAAIFVDYQAFMRRQEEERMDSVKAKFGKEIKIRDFTAAEKKLLDEIKKAQYTASGKRREALQQEYYALRRRGIRYSPTVFHGKANSFESWNLDQTNELMAVRRREFAKQSAKALALIPNSLLPKWEDLQGKPYEFKPVGSKTHPTIGYR